MRSTEAIFISDYPFPESNRQGFGKKPHLVSGKRLFQAPICGLTACICPEISTFSNITGAGFQKYGLQPVSGNGGRDISGGYTGKSPVRKPSARKITGGQPTIAGPVRNGNNRSKGENFLVGDECS